MLKTDRYLLNGSLMANASYPKKDETLRPRFRSLSEEIRHMLLEKFVIGQLPSGTPINDTEISKKLGVSRTPVREALRGLQELGIVETLPARVTRVVKLTAGEFAHVKAVWASLYRQLLADVIDSVSDADLAALPSTYADLSDTVEADPATAAFQFFDELSHLSHNTFLRNIIHTAACRMRLGHADENNGTTTHFSISVNDARELVGAIKNRDLKSADNVLSRVLAGGFNGVPPALAESAA